MLKMHSSFRLYLMHGNLSAVTNSVSILALITFADSSAHVPFTVLSLSQRGIEFSIRWWEDNISTDIIKQYKKEIGMVMVMMKWDVCSLLLLLQLWTTLKIALAYIYYMHTNVKLFVQMLYLSIQKHVTYTWVWDWISTQWWY